MKSPTSTHKHQYRYRHSRGRGRTLLLGFRCECGDSFERPGTPAEQKWVGNPIAIGKPGKAHVHTLSHKIQKRLPDAKLPTITDQDRKLQIMSMFERMRDPGVRVTSCDDSAHAGSRIALVSHETDREYWGTTVYVITQCAINHQCSFSCTRST